MRKMKVGDFFVFEKKNEVRMVKKKRKILELNGKMLMGALALVMELTKVAFVSQVVQRIEGEKK